MTSISSTTHTKMKTDILIIGAGPTALGAASRLIQFQHDNYTIVEARSDPGGLAYTSKTPEGFLFDMGGHVIFSHYEYFDQLLDHAVGKGDEFCGGCPFQKRRLWFPKTTLNKSCIIIKSL